ncbi:MAG: hypothetical protein QW692_03840 [Nitrososphaerota archaeon]
MRPASQHEVIRGRSMVLEMLRPCAVESEMYAIIIAEKAAMLAGAAGRASRSRIAIRLVRL